MRAYATPAGLKFAWYGDDFTGASDTLATFAEAGLKALLFLDVPSAEQLQHAGPLDAVGIAGAARSMTAAEMRTAIAPVARFFASSGAPVLHYKCCSTFDSAPQTGSIGEAVRVLRAALGNRPALIVGGQPSLGRYCAFGQLYAGATAGGPVYRIDRHPTMSRHPVTPMDEADLRLHLGRQGLAPIASLDLRAYAQQGESLDATLDALVSLRVDEQVQAVLMDVVEDGQLQAIGRLIWRLAQASPQLCVGASSVAQAMLDCWGVTRRMHDGHVAPAAGPVLVLAGSMSPLSARQVAAAQSFQRIALDPAKLIQGDSDYLQRVGAMIAVALEEGTHVLAHTSAPPGQPLHATSAIAADGLAPACGQLLRRVLETTRVSRLGVAGGDTSSHAIQALAPTALEWLGRPAPGVALCRMHAMPAWLDGMEVMLKGGQMGDDGLFDRLVSGSL